MERPISYKMAVLEPIKGYNYINTASVRPDIRFRFRFRPIRPIFSNPVPVPVPAKFWPDWPDS